MSASAGAAAYLASQSKGGAPAKSDDQSINEMVDAVKGKAPTPDTPATPKPPEDWDKGAYRAARNLRKGGLHRALRLPEDKDIPADRLDAAKKSKNPHVRRMASLK